VAWRERTEQARQQARQSSERSQRDTAFQGVCAGLRDGQEESVGLAARLFLEAPGADDDPRKAQVLEAVNRARGLPARRRRDAACADLEKAIAAGDDRAVLAAAARFDEALRPGEDDPRSPQVRAWADLARKEPARLRRDAAYARLVRAVKAGADADIDAAADAFLASSPPPDDPRLEQARQAKVFAADGGNRRRRDEAYQRLVTAYAAGDEKGVAAAAEDFRGAAAQGKAPDPRAEQARDAALAAREWPNRRLLDAAFADLEKARTTGDDLAALRAAERFLRAPPVALADPRAGQVRGHYAETFVRWLARSPANTAEAAAVIAGYRALTARE
jgi:hypothetical protein